MRLLALFALALLALVAATVAAPDPLEPDYTNRFAAPTFAHPFGTDDLGRDVWARVLHSARADLSLALGVSLLTTLLGVLFGLATRLHTALDALFSALSDSILAFPNLVFILIVLTVAGAGVPQTVFALTLVALPGPYRLVRTLALGEWNKPYVEAARAGGARTMRLLWVHVRPNLMGPTVEAALQLSGALLLVGATLSYLGLGLPPPTPNWGAMLQDARSYFLRQPWAAVAPGLALVLAALVLDALGRGVRRRREKQAVLYL